MSFLMYLARVIRHNGGLSGYSLGDHHAIYKEWMEMQRSHRTPLEMSMPWISLLARNYLAHYLADRSRSDTRIFEYGSGGSSLFFLKYAGEVVSVEHDPPWYVQVRDRAVAGADQKWSLSLIEPQPVERAGDPSDPYGYASADERFAGMNFQSYVTRIDRFPENYFDVVLVDGRSRPSCLRHSAPKVKQNGLLVLDNAERTYYEQSAPLSGYNFRKVHSSYGALVASPQFTRTTIYRKD